MGVYNGDFAISNEGNAHVSAIGVWLTLTAAEHMHGYFPDWSLWLQAPHQNLFFTKAQHYFIV